MESDPPLNDLNPANLRFLAWQALCEAEPRKKANLTQTIGSVSNLPLTLPLASPSPLHLGSANSHLQNNTLVIPGRPARPELLHPAKVPRRAPSTLEGRAALIHSICHIEFNAINLALDAVWRFDGLPDQFYRDWAKVAREEAYHFTLLREHLRGMDSTFDASGQPSPRWDYGDFPAHDGLWEMCDKTAHDVVARMALVPRTLEARGLDATPQIQAKLRQVGTPDALRAVEILYIILRDEVGHVAIGNHWYRWLCERDGLAPVRHYAALTERYKAPKLRPPFNDAARRLAGFSDDELAALTAAIPYSNHS